MKRTRAGNWKRINIKATRVEEEGSRRISALRFSACVAWATALGVVASAPEMEMGRPLEIKDGRRSFYYPEG